MNDENTVNQETATDKKLTGIILGYEDGSMEYIEDGRVIVTQLFVNDDILTKDERVLNDQDSTKALFNYAMRNELMEDGWTNKYDVQSSEVSEHRKTT